MNKQLLALLAASLISGSTFAANATMCGFPQHVTVKMPAGVRIVEADVISFSDNSPIALINLTKDSFDVIQVDGNQCKGGHFRVRVADDNYKSGDNWSGNWASVEVDDFSSTNYPFPNGAGTHGDMKLWADGFHLNGNNIEIVFSKG